MEKFPDPFKLFETGFRRHDIHHPLIEQLNNPLLTKMLRYSDQVVVILNHSTLEYVYVSDNVKTMLGITVDEWMKLGASGLIQRMHPSDVEILSNVAFPAYFGALEKLTDAEKLRSRFTYTYRLKNRDGKYLQVMQQNIILAMEDGKITLGLIVLTDNSLFKNNDVICYTHVLINHPDRHRVLIERKVDQSMISPRESDVLHLMADGLSEKQIAEKLQISVNTVKTHKRKMIAKTKVSNSADLVRFGIANLLI